MNTTTRTVTTPTAIAQAAREAVEAELAVARAQLTVAVRELRRRVESQVRRDLRDGWAVCVEQLPTRGFLAETFVLPNRPYAAEDRVRQRDLFELGERITEVWHSDRDYVTGSRREQDLRELRRYGSVL